MSKTAETEQVPAFEGRRVVLRPWAAWVVHSLDAGRVGDVVSLLRGAEFRRASDEVGYEVVRDRRMSRRHARFRVSGDALRVEDLGSTNGTFVNGVRIREQDLRADDVVRMGDTLLVVGRMAEAEAGEDGSPLAGRAPAMISMRRVIARAAASGLSVLVTGESGTGKELCAASLHAQSGRRGKLVALNCAAIPETLVESALFGHEKGAFTGATSARPGAFVEADRGTLFLDEVAEMAVAAQPKLLRALETGEITPVGGTRPRRVDVRIVAATNRDLDEERAAGRFREDLYARLCGVPLVTAPLRARRQDILMLLERLCPDPRPLTADCAERLLVWSWPHNVRELENLARRLPVMHGDADTWGVEVLPEAMIDGPGPAPTQAPPTSQQADGVPTTREGLIALLRQCHWSPTRVAKQTGRSRRQVYRWLERFDVDPQRGRDGDLG